MLMNKLKRTLAKHYNQFPFDIESHHPDMCLSMYEDSIKYKHDKLSISERMMLYINIVSHLECFTYRAVNHKNGESVYWNPLTQPFASFMNTKTIVYQTDTHYPAPDMITNWCLKKKADI